MKLSDFPESVISHYNLGEKATPYGFFYVAIKRGMYGLPQIRIISQTLLETHLNAHGYHQSKITPSLFTHEWRPICFTLVVDNSGVKYVGKEHDVHLIMGFPRVESLPNHSLKHASMPMATIRARLHPVCGHMHGVLSISRSLLTILE